MTVLEREKIDFKFKRRSKIFKFIRKNINYKIGSFLVDYNYDKWDESYN